MVTATTRHLRRRTLRRELDQGRNVLGRVKRRLLRQPRHVVGVDAWATDPGEGGRLLAGATTDMEREFYGHQGRYLTKWTHYLPVYDEHLSRFRGTGFGLLEIGVFEGGSLQLWRRYFGDQARIMGIDINPACAALGEPPTMVRIGSQDDPEFLRACAAELGRLDVVIDDGSHVGRHQWASFHTLFPLLAEGGLYVIEDLHTSYWSDYERRPLGAGTGIGLVRTLIDDMHAWYHDLDDVTGASHWVPALHVYDSMVVIEKRHRDAPRHFGVGG